MRLDLVVVEDCGKVGETQLVEAVFSLVGESCNRVVENFGKHSRELVGLESVEDSVLLVGDG